MVMISQLSNLADRMRNDSNNLPSLASNSLKIFVGALILIGLTARLSPLFDLDGRLFWQYMSEDGYLMQTIARNIAIGLGMSTAEGTIPTNGVQPLATFLFASLHFLAGGSKVVGIAMVTLFSAFVSALSAYYLFKVGSKIFSGLRHGRELAIVSAALWFAAPQIIKHSMNGLETGVYYLAILFTLNYYLAVVSDDAQPFHWKQRLILGVLLGISFLARNDAVFFVGGLLFAHLVIGGEKAGGGYRHRLTDCLVAGIASILVGAPWLVNNYALFGSIMPISGIAESFKATLGQNRTHVPANLFEAAFLFAPVPRSMESKAVVILLSSIAVIASMIGFWLFIAKLSLKSRRFALAGLMFILGISCYYGLFFGAPWFLERYISPLSPFLWLATSATIFFFLNLIFRKLESMRRIALAITAILCVEACIFAWSDFARGQSHMHRQVVEWVQKNLPASQWVGAPQTGTLGYFHDRTINFDGKVNPYALRALMNEGIMQNYVLGSKVNYVVDWAGIAEWIDRERYARFSEEFELVLNDRQNNLSVLRRIRPVE